MGSWDVESLAGRGGGMVGVLLLPLLLLLLLPCVVLAVVLFSHHHFSSAPPSTSQLSSYTSLVTPPSKFTRAPDQFNGSREIVLGCRRVGWWGEGLFRIRNRVDGFVDYLDYPRVLQTPFFYSHILPSPLLFPDFHQAQRRINRMVSYIPPATDA